MNRETTEIYELKVSSGLSDYTVKFPVVTLSKRQLYFAAISKSLSVFIFTLIGIFIPVLHFLLVPLGLFMTIYIFIRTIKSASFIEAGMVNCPECQHPVRFNRMKNVLPVDLSCDGCARVITLSNV